MNHFSVPNHKSVNNFEYTNGFHPYISNFWARLLNEISDHQILQLVEAKGPLMFIVNTYYQLNRSSVNTGKVTTVVELLH